MKNSISTVLCRTAIACPALSVCAFASAQLYRVEAIPFAYGIVSDSPHRLTESGRAYLNSYATGYPEALDPLPSWYEAGAHGSLERFDPIENRTVVYSGNSQGQAVGMTYNPSGGNTIRPVLWDSDGLRLLPTDGLKGEATDVNESGRAVGTLSSWGANWTTYPAEWLDGVLHILPTDGGAGVAHAVNDAGTVVGTADRAPAMWQGGQLRRLGLSLGEAAAIAPNGIVAGNGWDPSFGAVVYTWRDGALRTWAAPEPATRLMKLRVNSSGTVAGTLVGNDEDMNIVTFTGVWREDGAHEISDILDPSSAEWQIDGIADIDESGRLLAGGRRASDPYPNSRALILTPVPEPASVAALGLGFLWMARRRRSSMP